MNNINLPSGKGYLRLVNLVNDEETHFSTTENKANKVRMDGDFIENNQSLKVDNLTATDVEVEVSDRYL